MAVNYSMFVDEGEMNLPLVNSNQDFIVNEIAWMSGEPTKEVLYQQLSYKVIRKPKRLISHIQRIYFTFHNGMIDQLYAAIIDLLWVLDGKGRVLSERMVSATIAQLSEEYKEILLNYLKSYDLSLLTTNQFSVCTAGSIGVTNILIAESKSEDKHDVLDVARDYVEYSQLEEAVNLLEHEIFLTPDRVELQLELLNLYKVTKDHVKYMTMNDKLNKNRLLLSNEWLDAMEYFSGLSDEK